MKRLRVAQLFVVSHVLGRGYCHPLASDFMRFIEEIDLYSDAPTPASFVIWVSFPSFDSFIGPNTPRFNGLLHQRRI